MSAALYYRRENWIGRNVAPPVVPPEWPDTGRHRRYALCGQSPMAIAHTSNGQVRSVSRARTEGWFFVSRERADLAYGRIRLTRGFTMPKTAAADFSAAAVICQCFRLYRGLKRLQRSVEKREKTGAKAENCKRKESTRRQMDGGDTPRRSRAALLYEKIAGIAVA